MKAREVQTILFRILLVPFQYLENWLSLLYWNCAKIEKRCIFELFKVQTKIKRYKQFSFE